MPAAELGAGQEAIDGARDVVGHLDLGDDQGLRLLLDQIGRTGLPDKDDVITAQGQVILYLADVAAAMSGRTRRAVLAMVWRGYLG